MINYQFLSTLFVTGNVYFQSSVKQDHKCEFKGAEAVYLTVGDHFLHLFALLIAVSCLVCLLMSICLNNPPPIT